MVVEKIIEKVYSVGSKDWDRRLFDELIPLPDGTSYNAYLVIGSEKTVLIDTVHESKGHELKRHLKKLKIEKLDYIVSNHAEPDHSGFISEILEMYPEATVLTDKRCKGMLESMVNVPGDRVRTVEDGETVSLGDKTLEFIAAPWVHWPETIFTYLQEDKILFTCDFLGSHLATSDLYAHDEARVEEAAKRYYAEIMMPFRKKIKSHLAKIDEMEIKIIAPSHGPIYDKPSFILDLYKEWVSDDVKNVVLIPYVTMYGNTGKIVDYLVDALIEKGITVKPMNLTVTDLGDLAISLVDAATILLGSSIVLGGPHPTMVGAVYLANALAPKTKYIGVIGSYLWGEKLEKDIVGMADRFKAEFLETVMVRGVPQDGPSEELNALVETIVEKHRELGILN
ncbi:MAG: FprA family A-type flavoprotein [Candidatus Kariarchaeaceae archaeon]